MTFKKVLPALCFLCFVWFSGSPKLSAQCQYINLACNDLINVSINEDCYASVNADLILENPPFNFFPDDGVNYKILLQDEQGFPIIPSNQVGEEHVGQKIKASITLVPCNISCWGYIKVEDKIGPKFWNCVDGYLPDIEVDCDDFANGFNIPDPQLGGICRAIDALSFEDDTSRLNCNNEFAQSIHRVWTARDEAGNRTKCRQYINIRKYNLKEVVLPDDYIVYIDPEEDCNESQVVDPERTGFPTGIECPNIKYYYTDITYPQCGIQKKLLRDWFVMDWCTGQSFTHGQIVKIIDNTAPRVECALDTLSVPKASYLCEASPFLNPLRVPGFDTLGAVTVLDTCPEQVFVEVGYLPAINGKAQPLGSPYYTIEPDINGLYKVPAFEDKAWIRYCFSDACGNETDIPESAIWADSIGYCCYFVLEAEDKTPPTAICEGFSKVPLGSNGITEIPAQRFDDNSYDPCEGISHFEVRRESGSCPGYQESGSQGWGESVHFCCEDIGDTITIRLRVFDNAGNFSECLGLVCVSDPVVPVVKCPDYEVELACDEDYRDYKLIGFPESMDGCSNSMNIGEEKFDLSDFDAGCGQGSIFRTIEVLDNSGKLVKRCEQLILFEEDDKVKLQAGDFDFPPDITLDVCSSGGSLDPSFTGLPVTSKDFGCANIALTYNDSNPITQNSNGVCYTILREWQVVDWCHYHPSYPNQYILKSTQEIRVINTAKPEFVCPSDITVKSSGVSCEAEVSLKVSVASQCTSNFELRWTIDLFSDGNIDITGGGNDASGIYPAGKHIVRFTGRNFCGGAEESCSYRFTVEGDKPPTPICIAELTWAVGASGATEVWASDFDLKSEGGCEDQDLLFSFVPPVSASYPQFSQFFDCSDIINGVAEDIDIEIFVIDEEGRFSSCRSTLSLQDTGDSCPDQGMMNSVGGEIHTENLEPLEQVMVELKNMDTEETMTEMTGLTGDYAFSGINQGHFELRPHHDKGYLNGISTLDLLMIQRHILGLEELDSPYKLIAADVNRSSSVSAVDLIQLRKLILGIYDDLPEADSWTFVPASYSFPDEKQPWHFPEYMDLQNMNESMTYADFIAVKIGDVNNSAEAGIQKTRARSEAGSVYLSTYSGSYRKGELIDVPIMAESAFDMLGMQFTLEFDDDKMLFQGIDGASLSIAEDNFALLNKEAGKITFSIASVESISVKSSDVLFRVYFEARDAVEIEESVFLGSAVTRAELYETLDRTLDIDFVIRNRESSQNILQLFQNEPNPFEGSTQISFYNPKPQTLLLNIMDSTGKLLKTLEKDYDEGMHKMIVRADELPSSGLLFYRLQSGKQTITRKMIMVK